MLTEDRARIAARRSLRLWLMMVLTFVTGLVGAVGYLGFDRIFTGNIDILGMGLAGALIMKIHISIAIFVAAASTAVVAIVGHHAWGDVA
jgi:uncharacterized membrane protein YoaK (UPF0700 family)